MTEENFQDEIDDESPYYSADELQEENQQFEAELARDNRAEERRLREATDAQGKFKRFDAGTYNFQWADFLYIRHV